MLKVVDPGEMTSEELEQFLILCEVEKALDQVVEKSNHSDDKIVILHHTGKTAGNSSPLFDQNNTTDD